MKHLILAITIAAGSAAVPAFGADVGVSISIGQPGFYGQLDIGDVGRPRTVYSRPVVVDRGYRGREIEPLYLRVPPKHSRNWRKYCGLYDACGRPVYFVRDDWYNNVYVPHYRNEHREDRHDERDSGRDNERNSDRDNGRRDNDQGRDRNGR